MMVNAKHRHTDKRGRTRDQTVSLIVRAEIQTNCDFKEDIDHYSCILGSIQYRCFMLQFRIRVNFLCGYIVYHPA